ncbi:MAG: vitamin K epoxide reductase family protein [Candidatus Nanoarchaeia archaeon]
MKVYNLKYKIWFIFSTLALISSIILSFVPLSILCTPLEGCNSVQTSIYSKTLGVSNSYYGIAIFLFMSVISFLYIKKPNKHIKFLIDLGIFIGALIALYFLYLQQFVIHAYCKYCLIIDIGMIIAFIIFSIPEKKKNE